MIALKLCLYVPLDQCHNITITVVIGQVIDDVRWLFPPQRLSAAQNDYIHPGALLRAKTKTKTSKKKKNGWTCHTNMTSTMVDRAIGTWISAFSRSRWPRQRRLIEQSDVIGQQSDGRNGAATTRMSGRREDCNTNATTGRVEDGTRCAREYRQARTRRRDGGADKGAIARARRVQRLIRCPRAGDERTAPTPLRLVEGAEKQQENVQWRRWKRIASAAARSRT